MAYKPKKAADKPKKETKKGEGGSAPALDIGGLGRGIRLLVLWCLPVLALATWCLVRWHDGPELRHDLTAGHWHLLGRAFGGAGLAASVQWLFLPLGDWLRLYPVARFIGGSKTVWFLPMFLAFPLWLACYLLVPAAFAAGGWLAWEALCGLGLAARWHSLF